MKRNAYARRGSSSAARLSPAGLTPGPLFLQKRSMNGRRRRSEKGLGRVKTFVLATRVENRRAAEQGDELALLIPDTGFFLPLWADATVMAGAVARSAYHGPPAGPWGKPELF
jgi:hypothetical protein